MSEPIPRVRVRSGNLGLVGLLLLLVVIVYADPLFARRNFGGRDPLAYHYPVEKAIHDAYARGRLPVWISEISGGRPLLPNPNAGALYPVRPLLAWLPFPLAIRLFAILHWAAAGIGMLMLLRAMGVSRSGAWIGAVTYVFSAVSVSEAFYSNIQPGMALLPWALLGVRRLVTAQWSGIAVLSLVWALYFLVGDVFSIALAVFASVLWILIETQPSGRILGVVRLAAAICLGALAAAPQILATVLWIPETNRGVLGMRLGEAVLFSISPFRLLEFLIPYPFGAVWDLDNTRIWGWPLFHYKAVGFFSGLYSGAFAVVGVAVIWRAPSAEARFGRALLLTGLTASVLPSLVPARWARFHSPVPLRYPEKFAVAVTLALAILSGLAVDALRRRGQPARWPLRVGVLLCLLTVAAFLFPSRTGELAVRAIGAPDSVTGTASREIPGALAEACLWWMVTVIALNALGRGKRRGLVVSLILLTLVPIAANRRIAQTFREDLLFAPTPFARFLQRADPSGAFRTVGESIYRPSSELQATQLASVICQIQSTLESWDNFTHALWRRGTVFNRDFDVGDLSRMESLRHLSFLASGSRDSEAFFGSLALRWGIRIRDQEPLPGYRRFRGDALIDWDEHRRPFPDLRLLERWREETGALPAVNIIQKVGAGEIVIESGSRSVGSARPGSLRVIEKTPERLRLQTLASDPTWLFVLRGFWSYRTILLDDREVDDVPAQLAFSAVPIPPGLHNLEWREDVPGWSVSRWGPIFFLLALAWICRRAFLDGRRGAPAKVR